MQIYTPILKCKENDLMALGKVSDKTRQKIKPLIEVPPCPPKQNIDAYIYKISDYIKLHVPLGDIYVDVNGIKPGQVTSLDTSAIAEAYRLIRAKGRVFTPAYGFYRDENVHRGEALWDELIAVVRENNAGFCFRLELDDLTQPQETWSAIIEKGVLLELPTSSIDIMMDMGDINHKSVAELEEVILDFLISNRNTYNYRKLIISASCALKDVSSIEKEGVGSVRRNELLLWGSLQKEIDDVTSLVMGDYGVVHPNFTDQTGNANMNAKIRYTKSMETHYFRGHGLLVPNKDFEQYHRLAKKVVDSGIYLGRNYSYGDKFLADVASCSKKPGVPGDWVLADMNHHIEYTANQVSIISEKIKDTEDILELVELS